MGIFYWEKAFHAGKKIWKNDFAHSEKYSSYTTVLDTGSLALWNLRRYLFVAKTVWGISIHGKT